MIKEYHIELKKYQPLNTIGEGEFGKVYLIENKQSKQQYAAKVIKNKCSGQSEKKSFKKEIVTYSSIKYPTISQLVGYNFHNFDSKHYPVIVTKYEPNQSLQEMLIKTKTAQAPPQWTDTAKYITLLGTALAMNYLHSINITHKDLKPTNILLNERFYPQISDFVLTQYSEKELSKIFMKKSIANYFYVAPEINIGRPFTSKADVYSFGMIAYEIITNKHSPIQISDIPGEANQKFFKRLTSKEPTERPSFSEICKYIISRNFLTVFPNLNHDEVTTYLDSFKDDPYVIFLHGAFLDDNTSNKIETARLYKLAADKGNDKAMNNYACMLKHGQGVEMNKEEACLYYKKSADKGNSRAMYNYALMLENGDGVAMNKEEAARYYKMSADKGNDKAMYNYGHMLEHGEGVAANVKEAVRYYRMAIYKGNDHAMNNYALLLKHGDFIDSNKEATIYYYKLSIDRGNPDAMYNYALMLEDGDGVQIDKEKAAHFYKMSADRGNDKAMYNYAYMLEHGEGIAVNKKEAAHYYMLAIEKGNEFAMNNYANMKEKGDGVQMNKNEAAKYYKLAADKGNPVAMKNYAYILEKGYGVEINKNEAARYYKLAIEKGNVSAMFNYAEMLEKDNKKEADYYYKMAADKGNKNAMKKIYNK